MSDVKGKTPKTGGISVADVLGKIKEYVSGVGIRELIPVMTLILLLIISGFLSSSFFSAANMTNLLRQNAGLTIIAMGMLLVILTGGIDLSVGSMLALSAVLVAKLSLTMPTLAAICLAALFLMAMGAFAAYFVSFRSLAPFVVTLALMTVARGLAFIISKGTPIRIAASNWLIPFGNGNLMGLPYPALMALIIFLAVMLLLRYTSYGRLVKAVGSNKSAVRLSGIPVRFYIFSVSVISGLLCSFGGVISAARAGVGSGQVGEGLELDAIAAVVIGGASLTGGKGTALNTLMGVFILGLISNIMNLMNIHSYYQQIIKGLIIVFAALLQSSRKNDAA
jgi:ribose transport system permease protein